MSETKLLVSNPNRVVDEAKPTNRFEDLPVGSYFFLDDGSPGIVWLKNDKGRAADIAQVTSSGEVRQFGKTDNCYHVDLRGRTVRRLRVREEIETVKTIIIDGIEP